MLPCLGPPIGHTELMRILIVGASAGLGRAFIDGLHADGHEVIGVSRRVPAELPVPWISADFSDPVAGTAALRAHVPESLDVVIWNLGVWEPTAFTADYDFAAQSDALTESLVSTNVTGPLLALRMLLPRLFRSSAPKVILTGSTSALVRSGRPEVAFGATKMALNGIADALREQYRDQRLAVTVLQLGDLNTDDALAVPREQAAGNGDGALIPVHDVVDTVRFVLALSGASFVREIVLPPIADERF